MPTATIQTPEGRIVKLEVPEGATNEQILEFVQSQQLGSAGTAPITRPRQQEEVGLGRGVGQSALRGVTLGLSDEIISGLGALYAKAFGGEAVRDIPLSELIEQSQTSQRQEREAFREQRPITAFGTELAASLPTGGALLKGAQTAAGAARLGRAAAPVGLAVGGAVEGATFGEGETTQEVLQDAVVGGVMAPVSAKVFQKASPAVAKAFRRTYETVSQPVKSVLDGVFKVNPAVAKDFTKQDIPLSTIALSENNNIRRLNSILSGTFGSTGVIKKNIDNTLNNIESRVAKLGAKNLDEFATPQEAGETIQRGLRNFVDRFQAESSARYQGLNKFIKPEDAFPVNNSSALLQSQVGNLTDAPKLAQRVQRSPAFGLLNDIVEDSADGNLSFKSIKTYRTEVGNLIKENVFTGRDNALAKQVYQALSDDMKEAAASKGQKALLEFNAANDFYQRGIDNIENNLARYIKNKVPENVFNTLMNSKKLGDTKISSVLRSVSPEDQDIIRSAVIAKLGRGPDKVFSPRRFFKDYSNISKEAKDAFFGKQNQELRGSLDTLSRISRNLTEAQQFDNISRSADNLGNLALIGLGFYQPSTAVASFAGAAGASRLLTSPGFAKILANAAEKPVTSNNITRFLKSVEDLAVQNPSLANDLQRFAAQIGVYSASNVENKTEE